MACVSTPGLRLIFMRNREDEEEGRGSGGGEELQLG